MPENTTTITDGQSPRSPEAQAGLDLIDEASAVARRLGELVSKASPDELDEIRPTLEANLRRWLELLADYT